MAYQNGHTQHYPGHQPYPGTQQCPGQPGYPAYPGYQGNPATQTWPDQSWPDQPPGFGPPPPPPPPGYGMRGRPVGVHIVAIMQYVTGVALILAAGVIGVITFNDGRIGDTEVPQSIRGAVTGAGLAIAALALVAGFIALSIGRRIHRGRRGARILVIVLSAVSLGINIYTLVTTGVADPLSGLVLPTLYLVLLNTPPVRAYFRQR